MVNENCKTSQIVDACDFYIQLVRRSNSSYGFDPAHLPAQVTGRQPGLFLAVIPAYNEADHISELVGQVQQFLPVLVVDDGSSDETARLAKSAGAEVLRQVPNQGKGAALRAGFRWALAQGATQSSLSMQTGSTIRLRSRNSCRLYEFTRWPDHRKRKFDAMPFSRRLANTTGRWLLSWALGQSMPDNQSGYRLISRRLMEALLDSTERGFEFEVEMIATCLKNGFPLAWVPIRTIYAGEASHIHPLRHVANYFSGLCRVAKERIKTAAWMSRIRVSRMLQ